MSLEELAVALEVDAASEVDDRCEGLGPLELRDRSGADDRVRREALVRAPRRLVVAPVDEVAAFGVEDVLDDVERPWLVAGSEHESARARRGATTALERGAHIGLAEQPERQLVVWRQIAGVEPAFRADPFEQRARCRGALGSLDDCSPR